MKLLSTEYDTALRARLVQEYISENSRAPSIDELNSLMIHGRRQYSSLDAVGFSGFDVETVSYGETASADKENTMRLALFDDLKVIDEKLDHISGVFELSMRGLIGTSRAIGRGLTALESRLDNLILMNESSDLFVYGAEETFDNQDKIDFSRTTASVETLYCTMGKAGYNYINLSDAKITSSITSDRALLSVQTTTSIEHLKSDDGIMWEQLVYTNYELGRVSLTINIELAEPADVSSFRFSGVPTAINSHLTATVFYSTDGVAYTSVDPIEKVITTSEVEFSIGIDRVTDLRIIFSKNAADSSTSTTKQYVYVFSLDGLKIYTDGFKQNVTSTLYAGPYTFYDEEGDLVKFSRAAFSVCDQQPTGTSISYFLSNDNVNWLSVLLDDVQTASVASFEDGSMTGSYDSYDSSLSLSNILDNVTDLSLSRATEAILNIVVMADYTERLIKNSVVIQRNTPYNSYSGVTLFGNIFGVERGWFNYDPTANQQLIASPSNQAYLITTVYVVNAAGINIDLGHTSAIVNGNTVSGLVLLAPGYNTFATHRTNYQVIDSGITSIANLRRADPLYPYNHKYLIEGYNYPASFSGEHLYPGAGTNFGYKMRYTSNEEFSDPDNSNDLTIFTLDETTSNTVFKIKTNKSDSSWTDEQFSATWSIRGLASEEVWVKAILQASDSNKTPSIESYKIRVI